MRKIIDDRTSNRVNLCNIPIGDCFIWGNDYACQRLLLPIEMVHGMEPDTIACVFIRSGEVICIDRLAWVEPIDVEEHIVDKE